MAPQPRSWKDWLLGTVLWSGDRSGNTSSHHEKEEFELTESDIVKSIVNGIPSIKFSDRVNQLLIKNMAHTIVIKLLGRSIGYTALYNKVCSLWKPSQAFRLINVENGYFQAKF